MSTVKEKVEITVNVLVKVFRISWFEASVDLQSILA